jgi:hypothetical protein
LETVAVVAPSSTSARSEDHCGGQPLEERLLNSRARSRQLYRKASPPDEVAVSSITAMEVEFGLALDARRARRVAR